MSSIVHEWSSEDWRDKEGWAQRNLKCAFNSGEGVSTSQRTTTWSQQIAAHLSNSNQTFLNRLQWVAAFSRHFISVSEDLNQAVANQRSYYESDPPRGKFKEEARLIEENIVKLSSPLFWLEEVINDHLQEPGHRIKAKCAGVLVSSMTTRDDEKKYSSLTIWPQVNFYPAAEDRDDEADLITKLVQNNYSDPYEIDSNDRYYLDEPRIRTFY
jgi:hypothetical protein